MRGTWKWLTSVGSSIVLALSLAACSGNSGGGSLDNAKATEIISSSSASDQPSVHIVTDDVIDGSDIFGLYATLTRRGILQTYVGDPPSFSMGPVTMYRLTPAGRKLAASWKGVAGAGHSMTYDIPIGTYSNVAVKDLYQLQGANGQKGTSATYTYTIALNEIGRIVVSGAPGAQYNDPHDHSHMPQDLRIAAGEHEGIVALSQSGDAWKIIASAN
jgi:hypothetical protein